MLALHWTCLNLGETHFTPRIVALNLQEAQTQLLPVSAFPHVNGECEQHTAALSVLPRLLEINGQRERLSLLHLPGSFHTGVVPQLFNKEDLDSSFRKSQAELSSWQKVHFSLQNDET